MLIRLFKTSHPVSYILLLVLALVLRIPLFFSSQVSASSGAFVANNLSAYVASQPYVFIILSALIVGIAGAFLNYLSDTFNFLDRVSGLTGLAFVLMASIHPVASAFGADTIALLFLLPALHQVLSLTKEKAGLSKVFNAGFLIAVASLFQPLLLSLELLVIFSVLYFQTFDKRHISVHIIGILVPLIYFAVYDLIWLEGDFLFSYLAELLLTWKRIFHFNTWASLLLPFLVLVWSLSAFLNSISI